MAIRVLGENLNDKKLVPFALAAAVYGIGIKRAQDICKKANIPETKRVKDLNDQDALLIQDAIKDLGYIVSNDLERLVRSHNRRLSSIRCHRWLCRERGVPCRGQRSRSNGNTASRLGGRKV
jgi:small subunit ribosomal protein S13